MYASRQTAQGGLHKLEPSEPTCVHVYAPLPGNAKDVCEKEAKAHIGK
jgi:hypothetical protein